MRCCRLVLIVEVSPVVIILYVMMLVVLLDIWTAEHLMLPRGCGAGSVAVLRSLMIKNYHKRSDLSY